MPLFVFGIIGRSKPPSPAMKFIQRPNLRPPHAPPLALSGSRPSANAVSDKRAAPLGHGAPTDAAGTLRDRRVESPDALGGRTALIDTCLQKTFGSGQYLFGLGQR